MHWIETVLGVLAKAGFDGADLVIAQRTIVNYLVGAIEAEHHSSLQGAGAVAMSRLPDADFPHVSRTAKVAQGHDPGG